MMAVDEQLSGMSELEKTEWISNVARTTKEKNRVAFLESFKQKVKEKDLTSAVAEIEKWFDEIENGDVYFERSSYEVYGEGYWDSDYEFEYSDEFGIVDNLIKSFTVAEEVLFQRQYKRVVELYEYLCTMTFQVYDDETGEADDLELEDLVEENLARLNLKQIALYLMYAKYQTANGHTRSSDLYRYFTWDMSKNIKVEELFTVGPEELSEINSFIKEWISFLQSKDGDLAGKLLIDACLYYGSTSYLLDIARATYDKHPILYKRVCEQLLSEQKYSECVQIGLEAIGKLPKDITVRADLANVTAEAAIYLGDSSVVHRCYEAAFYSNASINHYLRLFELPNYKEISNSAAKYAILQPASDNRAKENKKIIQFFNGDFEKVYEDCKKDSATLGWSGRFKGIGIVLFLILLNRHNKISNVGQRLLDGIKHRVDFAETDADKFASRIMIWKEQAVLTDEQNDRYIKWLSQEVDKRVEAIVGGKYRTSYYKAALLVAALGEVLESNGTTNGKMKLIEHYHKAHSRKSAFRAELKELTN